MIVSGMVGSARLPAALSTLPLVLCSGVEHQSGCLSLLSVGPGGVNERDLLLNGALQVYDNLPNLSGCHSSSARSGIGQLHGFRGRLGLLAFPSCLSPGPGPGRWCKVFRCVDHCASSLGCGGKGLGSPRGCHPSGISSRSAHNTIILYRNSVNHREVPFLSRSLVRHVQ